MKIGDRLRELRYQKKLSQRGLAVATQISKNRIGRIERGDFKPTFEEVITLAEFFNVSTDDLAH
jgi:transcriptional regulator with XRE-family HTH domain